MIKMSSTFQTTTDEQNALQQRKSWLRLCKHSHVVPGIISRFVGNLVVFFRWRNNFQTLSRRDEVAAISSLGFTVIGSPRIRIQIAFQCRRHHGHLHQHLFFFFLN